MKKIIPIILLFILPLTLLEAKIRPNHNPNASFLYPLSKTVFPSSATPDDRKTLPSSNEVSEARLGEVSLTAGKMVDITLTKIHIYPFNPYVMAYMHHIINGSGIGSDGKAYQVRITGTRGKSTFIGTWTQDSIDYSNTFVSVTGESTRISITSATATITPSFGSYQIHAELTDADAKVFNIVYEPFAAKDTVLISFDHKATQYGHNPYIEDESDDYSYPNTYFLEVANENDDYKVSISSVSNYGTPYDIEDYGITYLIKKANNDTVKVLQSPQLLLKEKKGSSKIKDTTFVYTHFVGTDSIYYDITIYDCFPTPKDTQRVNISSMTIKDYYETYGYYEFSGQIGDSSFSFAIRSPFITGTFTEDDLFTHNAFNGLTVKKEKKKLYSAEISITNTESSIIFKGTLLSDTSLMYLTMTFPIEQRKDNLEDVSHSFVDASFVERRLYISSQFAENGINYNLVFAVHHAEEMTNSQNIMSIVSSDVEAYLLTKTEAGNKDTIRIWSINGSLQADKSQNTVSVNLSFLTNDTIYFSIRFDASVSVYTVPGDADDEGYIRTFTENDYIYANDSNVYSEYYIDLYLENDSELVVLTFYVDDYDDNICIPAGTYTIDNTLNPLTVASSVTVDDNGVPYTSCAIIAENETTIKKFYSLVRGTVEVEKTGSVMKLTVDGVNSHKREIHINYEGKVISLMSDIPIIVSDVGNEFVSRKTIIDGNIYILRGNKVYDIFGREVY